MHVSSDRRSQVQSFISRNRRWFVFLLSIAGVDVICCLVPMYTHLLYGVYCRNSFGHIWRHLRQMKFTNSDFQYISYHVVYESSYYFLWHGTKFEWFSFDFSFGLCVWFICSSAVHREINTLTSFLFFQFHKKLSRQMRHAPAYMSHFTEKYWCINKSSLRSRKNNN